MQTDEIFKLTRESIHELLHSRLPLPDASVQGERRHSPRWPFPGTVEIYLDENTECLGTCRNLNETGFGMSCDRYFEPESRVKFAVHLPEASFCGAGVVRYCMHTPRGYMTGIEFDFSE